MCIYPLSFKDGNENSVNETSLLLKLISRSCIPFEMWAWRNMENVLDK